MVSGALTPPHRRGPLATLPDRVGPFCAEIKKKFGHSFGHSPARDRMECKALQKIFHTSRAVISLCND